MTTPTLHLIRLSPKGARWAELVPGAAGLEPRHVTALPGEGLEPLNLWMERVGRAAASRAELALIDTRGMMFSLSADVPAAARKQADGIARLKIRQELGLGDDQVVWTLQWAASNTAGHLRMLIDVIWRDKLQDIQDWAAANRVGRLWVGGDLPVVRSLMTRADASGPISLVEIEEDEATIYARDIDGRLTRSRVNLNEILLPSANDEPAAATIRVARTGDAAWEVGARRALENAVIEWVEPRFTGTGAGEKMLARLGGRGDAGAWGLGATLAGLICELKGSTAKAAWKYGFGPRPSLPSLIQTERAADAAPEISGGRSLLKPSLALGVAVIALGATLVDARSTRERVRLDLVKEANSLETKTRMLEAQAQVLRKVKSDRKKITPIYEATLTAATRDLSFDVINLTESGSLQIEGRAQSQEGPTRFFESMAASKLFERCQLQDLKIDAKGKYSFQFTALLKDRRKR